jgi:hypothetical protein
MHVVPDWTSAQRRARGTVTAAVSARTRVVAQYGPEGYVGKGQVR